MENPPPEKRLRMAPFAVHATRGILRDQRARRKTMAITLAIAVVLTIAGLTVLRPWLDPHEHPWRFIFYWLACAWEIVLVLLLALYDLLMVRTQTRTTKTLLQQQIQSGDTPESASKTED